MDNADPAKVVKEVAEKLEQNVKESGLDVCEQFVDALEDVKEAAKNGPGDIMDKVKGEMEKFKKGLEDAMNDPSSLMPAGGFAACASWYGAAIVAKLKDLMAVVDKLVETIVNLAKEMAGPLKDVGATMTSAMEGINKTVKGLTSIPKEVRKVADKIEGPDDLKDLDTDAMKKALDTSGIEGPLGSLETLKTSLGPTIKSVNAGVGSLNDFIGSAPDKIKDAFAVPAPLTCLTPCAMSQAPAPMTQMLEKVESLKALDLSPLVKMLKGLADNLSDMDVSKVKEPVNKFAEMAGEQIDTLDKTVKAAKMGGAVSNLKGKFGF